ncbi:MAG TPA: hypothetical protein PLN69_03450 [bacterium]|nr:hypothetical protein [bacterium]
MNIRVWAEYFSPEEALDKKVTDLLKKYDVTLGMAFPPGSINDSYAAMLAEYQQLGIPVMLWVLLPDESGYWACESNANEFTGYTSKIFDWADEKGFGIPWLAVDLELPHGQMERMKNAKGLGVLKSIYSTIAENRNRGRFYTASAEYNRLIETLHSRGTRVLTAAASQVAEDILTGTIGTQDIMETPISTVNFDVISFMIYTSMISGYSKGLISPRDARWYLYRVMQDMKEMIWDRAGVSIGVTYTGKLGDEPYYESPEQLKPDMQAVKAALIEDISIFNLEGIVRSPQPEAWFETLIECEAAVPQKSLKVNAVRKMLQAASKIL